MGLPTPYQEYIHLSRYSRYDYTKNRRETWEETVDRYFNFFKGHLLEQCKFKVPPSTITNIKKTTDQITDFLKLTDRGIYQVDPLSRRSASLQMTQHAQNNTIKISKDIMENTENKQYIEIVDQHHKFKTDTYDIDNLLPNKTIVYPSTFCQETLTGLKSGFINIKTE